MYVLLSAIVVALSLMWWRSRNLPPGPWSLPIVGYLPWLDPKKPYITLHELSKKYGSVYGLYMGNIYTVVLSDAQLIRKLFSKDAVTGRAPLFLTHGLMKGCGLICAEGALWKDQRKFVYGCLRQMGCTKIGPQRRVMEGIIWRHVEDFLKSVESFPSPTKLVPSEHLRHSVGSFMNEIIFGESWSKDDETWLYLQHLQEEGIKHIGIAGPLNFIPLLRHLPKFRKTIHFLTEGLRTTHEIYDGIIAKHKLTKSREPTNFLDAFLLEKERKRGSPEYEFYSDQQFRYLLADLFGAGLDTTLTTLNWYILYMSTHKNIQTTIREELANVLGGRAATTDDYQFLPLFEASVAEVQRIRSTVPIGIPHGTTEVIKIEEFIVPKGTMIIPLQWTVHMAENQWKEPNVYNPERFLDDNGKFFKPTPFMPFQIGKRVCVGEDLARMLLYNFCSSILQKFELSVEGDVDFEGNCGITLTPNDYQIIFKKID